VVAQWRGSFLVVIGALARAVRRVVVQVAEVAKAGRGVALFDGRQGAFRGSGRFRSGSSCLSTSDVF
jgi:hypothetical protein